MARVVLCLFGALYLVLGVWCIVAPEVTARKVGLELVGGAGRSEFIVVYGGLEIALGVFFLWCGRDPALWRAGLFLALISSACLAIARTATLVLVPDVPESTHPFFAAEVAMALVSASAFWVHARASRAAA
jgi:hypothetical protein